MAGGSTELRGGGTLAVSVSPHQTVSTPLPGVRGTSSLPRGWLRSWHSGCWLDAGQESKALTPSPRYTSSFACFQPEQPLCRRCVRWRVVHTPDFCFVVGSWIHHSLSPHEVRQLCLLPERYRVVSFPPTLSIRGAHWSQKSSRSPSCFTKKELKSAGNLGEDRRLAAQTKQSSVCALPCSCKKTGWKGRPASISPLIPG